MSNGGKSLVVFGRLCTLFCRKKIRFLFAGGLNTIFGYSVYAIFVFVGVPYLASLFVATILGVVFNYFSFGRMVFEGQGGGVTFRRFVVSYVAIYCLNALVLEILTAHSRLDPYLSQLLCIFPSILVGWFLMNYWVYKRS